MILGVGGAFFSYGRSATKASSSAALKLAAAPRSAAKPASVAQAPIARAPQLTIPAEVAALTPPKAVESPAAGAPPKAVESPARPSSTEATLPSSNVASPSCRELLGAAFSEKVDAVASFDETQRGTRKLVHGDLAEAQRAYCNAAQWDARNVERWLNLAQLFLLRRDAAQATDAARMALELQPANPRALNALGDAWAMLGRADEARVAYLNAEKNAQPDAPTLKAMARRDYEEAERTASRRDFARAERMFRRVVVFDPEHQAATVGVARCLSKLGQPQLADAWVRRAAGSGR
jgi:tetratricopeptide (TPR) repeat protein